MLPPNLESIVQSSFFLIVHAWALYVSASIALLFWTVHRKEHQLRTPWRAIGFLTLAISYGLTIGALFALNLHRIAVPLEALGFALILFGVRKELVLSHLHSTPNWQQMHEEDSIRTNNIAAISSLPVIGLIGSYAISAVCIAATIALQLRRYVSERANQEVHWHNLYPLLAYVFLLIKVVFFAAGTLYTNTLLLWTLGLITTGAAFTLLAIWAWVFIRIRKGLRLSLLVIILSALAITVAIFTVTALLILLFRILLI